MAKPGILEHQKLFKLGRLLGMDPGLALGPLEGFLHFVARSYPSGDVSRVDPEILVDAIRCPSLDPERFWQALVAAEFVDALADGRRVVHDWPEHCNDAVHMALARKGGHFWDGTRPRLSRFQSTERARIEAIYAQKSAPETPESAGQAQGEDEDSHGKRTASARQAHGVAVPFPSLPCPKEHDLQTVPNFVDGASPPREPSGSSSSPSEPVPDRMPDGTRRLTDAEVETLDRLRADFTRSVIVGSAVQAKYRRLFDAGLTVALLEETVREVMEIQRRKQKPDWRAGGLEYFLRSLEEALEAQVVSGNGSMAAGRPQYDNDERLDRRRELISAGMKGDEAAFQESAAGWAARLEALGYSEAEVSSEVGRLLEDARLNVKAIKGARNGRAGRPDAADPQPADSRS